MQITGRFYRVALKYFLLIVLLVHSFCASAQKDFFQPSPTYNPHRATGVIIGESVLATTVTLWLNYLWYKKFPHSKFHFFNDNDEWLNMDDVQSIQG